MKTITFRIRGGELNYDPQTQDVTINAQDIDIHSDDLKTLIGITEHDTLEFIDLNSQQSIEHIADHYHALAEIKQIEFDNALVKGDNEAAMRLATLKIKYAMIARNIQP